MKEESNESIENDGVLYTTKTPEKALKYGIFVNFCIK
jgi:hypothetical protein